MTLAVIGGTGTLELFEVLGERTVDTSFGPPSAALAEVEINGRSAWFLARHGRPHHIPPHRINARANIDALRQLGVEHVIAVSAVGGIEVQPGAGGLALPDQLIDYTWGRAHTFSDGELSPMLHVEFAEPFAGRSRSALVRAAAEAGVAVLDGGCLAVTQGPRLETAAEVRRMARDGATLIGMTGMPEAALAREAGLDYANLCVVANPAAGLSDQPISEADIHGVLAGAMRDVRSVLEHLVLDSGA